MCVSVKYTMHVYESRSELLNPGACREALATHRSRQHYLSSAAQLAFSVKMYKRFERATQAK